MIKSVTPLYQIRIKVCSTCEHYEEPPAHLCRYVASLSSLPGKLGKLDHPQGLANPCTSCPIGKFTFVLNQQTAFIHKEIPEIPLATLRLINKNNIGSMDTFFLGRNLHTILKSKHAKTIKLSYIISILDKAGALSYSW